MVRPLAYITANWSDNEFEAKSTALRYCRKVYDAGFSPIGIRQNIRTKRSA